jgi:hypothetical protein
MAKTKKPTGRSVPVKKKIIHNVIRDRANEIYKNRIKSGIHGDADSDWLQAERELMN